MSDLVGDAHINVNANTDPASRALRDFSRTADGRLRDVRGRFVSESRLINTAFNRAAGGGTAFNGMLEKLKSAAIQLSPALIPIAAQAAPIAVGVGAAAAAVGAFAAAAGGQVVALTEAADAEAKYKQAVDQHGAASKEALQAQAEYVRQVKTMPPATREAAASLSSFKDQYKQWSDSLAGDTMPVVTRGLQAFGAIFPKLTPMVQGAGVQLNRFVTIAAGGIQSGPFNAFMRSFSDFAVGALQRGNDMLIRFMRTLNTGKISGGISTFMQYVRDNGPIVRETLTNVMQALANIGLATANVGPGLLTVVNVIAKLVAALPPDVITHMLQLALALKAVRLAAAAAAATSAGITAFAASIGVMRVAAAGATGVLPKLGAAIATLSRTAKVAIAGTGIGLLLIALTELSQRSRGAPPDVDKLTTSLAKLGKTGKTTGEAAKAFGTDLDGLYGKVRSLTDPSTTDNVQQFLVGWTGWDSTPVKDAKDNLGAVDDALAGLVKNNQADLAAAAVKRLTAEYGKGGRDTKEFTSRLTEYKASLEDAKFEQQLAADAMGLFGTQAQKTSAKLAEQKASADGLRQAIQALNDVNRSALGGMIGFEASIDAASKAATENAGVLRMVNGVLDVNSPKAQAAATALNDLAAKTDEAAAANRESSGSWQGSIAVYERGRQQLVKNAMQMGLTREEAQQLASQILKTPNKTAMLKADITDWKTKIGEAEQQLKTAKGDKKAKLTADIADWKAKVAAADLQLKGTKADKRAKLTADVADWRAKVAAAEAQLRTAKGEKKAKLTANISDWQSKISAAQRQINGLPPSKSTRLIVWKITNVQTNYVPSTTKSGSAHDAVGATGGLFTGKDFKYRGQHLARGGLVNGPGTETSDDVYAPWLSKNEFVVNAKQTARHLPLLKAINSGGLGMAVGGMAGAGTDVAAGLASGMAAATGMVVAAARAMAAAVDTAVRAELQISSPSKKLQAIGKNTGAGFIKGLTGTKAQINATAKSIASAITSAFKGTGSRTDDRLVKLIDSGNKRLQGLAVQRDALVKKIADANKFATDTATAARSTGSLASIVQEDAYSPKYVKSQMQASLNQIKTFTANVEKLKKKGLNKDLLRQILEMGPEQGAAFAKSLAGADAATIKQYNSLNTQISTASTKLGKAGADMLYDSGKKAGQGFLTGLKAQQKDIEKLMLNIAKSMQKAIKKALGIKSPSRVMDAIGRMTTLGLSTGIVRTLPDIRTAMTRVAGAVTSGAPTTLPALTSPAVALGTVPSSRGVTASAPTIVTENHYYLVNQGVIGSQIELQNWFVGMLDNAARTNRIPTSLKQAVRSSLRAA
ncbi:hypothetical protein AB0D91_05135 [Streptomyces canus]|uniref:hypothetical protein n=1 Tax=Streptomyces canus TaxID=58343 RepID=UPI0033C0E5A7